MTGTERNTGKMADDIAGVAAAQRDANGVFAKMLAALKTARKPEDIRKAVAEAVAQVIGKQRGNVENTRATLAGLRAALARTHDPKLEAAIRSAIAKVQAKIPGREYAQKQIASLGRMLADGKLSKAELKRIAGIERDLKDRGLPHAANEIKSRVDAAKRAQVAAANATSEAIRRKNLKAELTVSIGGTTVNVNARNVFATSRQVTKYYSTSSAGPGK
jgi:hypothetical protein